MKARNAGFMKKILFDGISENGFVRPCRKYVMMEGNGSFIRRKGRRGGGWEERDEIK